MKTSLCFIIVIFLFCSCTKRKNCPAFDEADLKYLPYNERDTVGFVNSKNDTFYIYTNKMQFSEAYIEEYNTAFNSWICLNYVALSASDSEIDSLYEFLRMDQSEASGLRNFRYQLFDFQFEIDFDNELRYIDDFEDRELLAQVTVNSKLYQDVVTITDLYKSSRIKSVYLNKKNGIIKFIEKEDEMEWIIMN